MAFTSVAKLETTAPMTQARETNFKKLVDQGYISGHTIQDKARERVELERDLVTQRENLTTLKAPVAAVVQQLAIHTTGGVTEAQALMIIVPEGVQVTAEVTLENRDIGFVSAGNGAEIKLETFPYTRYDTVQAGVDRVTADAITMKSAAQFFRDAGPKDQANRRTRKDDPADAWDEPDRRNRNRAAARN
ncbi:HlyD family efflux transporter periplasmic adaptor subunit [Polaromonas sp. P5_D5]